MYFVELGERGEVDYYCFNFKIYKDAIDFAKTIIDNGYYATIGFDETEE